MKTPKESISILMLAFFLYITAPIVEGIHLLNAQSNGEFPVNADSIGIPFFGFLVIWIFCLPFISVFLIWAIWKYPAEVPLFGFNRARSVWSWFWTVLFALLISNELSSTLHNFMSQDFVQTFQNLVMSYFFLLLRAVIIFRKL